MNNERNAVGSCFRSTICYLLVTHIRFARDGSGQVITDGLWLRDLENLAASVGRIRVAAPEEPNPEGLDTWGPGSRAVPEELPLEFIGLPRMRSSRDVMNARRIRAVLRREVDRADLVHTSNFFPPYSVLGYAHRRAVRKRKKTLFVIAEDFYDMLEWEWVRTAANPIQRLRRQVAIEINLRRVRRAAQTASLTFFHTPAVTKRFRTVAKNGIAIRQPLHGRDDVISLDRLTSKCREIRSGTPLKLVAACRHKPLKGLDFLIRAVHFLKLSGVHVELRIYGEGEQTSRLKLLVDEFDLANQVAFCGTVPNGPPLYERIYDAHVFVMPHRTADFGRAFFDGIAVGAPVIAFKTPASEGTVRDGIDGLLAVLDDVESLASAILRFHDDRELLIRASHEARQRALLNTADTWFQLRAAWIGELLDNTPALGQAGEDRSRWLGTIPSTAPSIPANR